MRNTITIIILALSINMYGQGLSVPEGFTVEKLPLSLGKAIGITFTFKDHSFI